MVLGINAGQNMDFVLKTLLVLLLVGVCSAGGKDLRYVSQSLPNTSLVVEHGLGKRLYEKIRNSIPDVLALYDGGRDRNKEFSRLLTEGLTCFAKGELSICVNEEKVSVIGSYFIEPLVNEGRLGVGTVVDIVHNNDAKVTFANIVLSGKKRQTLMEGKGLQVFVDQLSRNAAGKKCGPGRACDIVLFAFLNGRKIAMPAHFRNLAAPTMLNIHVDLFSLDPSVWAQGLTKSNRFGNHLGLMATFRRTSGATSKVKDELPLSNAPAVVSVSTNGYEKVLKDAAKGPGVLSELGKTPVKGANNDGTPTHLWKLKTAATASIENLQTLSNQMVDFLRDYMLFFGGGFE